MSAGESVPAARATILVQGHVQGVFFRASAMEEAQSLGIAGYVKNLPDGGVEAVAEGNREQVEAFIAWCRRGPPSARVDEVKVHWEEPTGEFRTFTMARW